MKNIVLCFDHTDDRPGPRDATNIAALYRLLATGPDQLTWYHPGPSPQRASRRHRHLAAQSRAAIIDGYRFVERCWEPGDRVYLFGSRYGGHRACELASLLGTVGLLPTGVDDLLDYALATYVLPRTRRTVQDWRHVADLTAALADHDEIVVPVHFLGLFDAVAIPGAQRVTAPLDTVTAGRHAVPIDAGRALRIPDGSLSEVWFRGGPSDIAGGPGACWPLADIALDWILTGAVTAGLSVRDRTSCPNQLDALTPTAVTLQRRRTGVRGRVHASVEMYVRAHPRYWRRLPARVDWVDVDWLARGERLARRPATALVGHRAPVAAAS